jgi:ADP-ribosylglycohydrolase
MGEGCNDKYQSLREVLARAIRQVSEGKGNIRHATGQDYTDQPIMRIQEMVGTGFALGQAVKKIQESTRLTHNDSIEELLGAINYIAAAIIYKERKNE